MKRIVSGIVLTLLLIDVLILAFEIQPVKASGTIYIRADGSIEPPTAPISSIDNITYTFTGNIYESIVIQRDNIVLEGSGYTLQGSGSGNGIDLTSTYNVTIKNANIMGFHYGVYLYHSSNNVVLSNNMTENGWAGVELDYSTNNVISINNMVANNYGIDLKDSVNNTISENEIERSEGMYAVGIRVATSNDINISGNNITANNNDGIWLLYSSNNIIIGNSITANKHDGVELDYSTNNSIIRNNITVNGVYGVLLNDISSNNVVSGNNIKRNMFGIGLSDSSNNSISVNNITANENGVFLCGLSGSSNNSIFVNNITANTNVGIKLYNSLRNIIFHNNFVNNQDHVFFVNESCINVWDDGYPSGGNYWSDYNGVDLYCGSYQNETGSDGIGDTPYVIDANNTDHYPLMNPTSAPIISGEVRILKPEDGFVAAGSVDITFSIINMGDPVEFKKGDAHNRIDLEIEFIDKAFGVQVWSTSFDGLTLGSGQILTKTVTYDAISQEVYGDVIIRIVHWKYNLVTEVYEFGEFGMHEIRGTLLPPLSVSISPLSASILVGQSVTFTSTVSGGYTPYGHQWHLNGNPVSGANLTSWTFTPTTSGIYYIYLKVTDAKGNTAQSDAARITVATVPVGGYSVSTDMHTTTRPLIPYLTLIATITAVFTIFRRKKTKTK